MNIDEEMMRRCLDLGRIALGKGDAPVGSVLVRNGEIIAQSIEAVRAKNDPTAHAEIEALRFACEKLQTLDLSDSVLYTNIEPCWMCSYAIRQTRLERLVFGIRNEKVGGFSSRYQVLIDGNLRLPVPQIESGILQEECELLLAEYQKEKE
jgi:tRNA(adenine34) deaminase